VQQDALVPIDEGDLALAARGRSEAGVVGEGVGLGVQLSDVDHVGAERALHHRELDVLALDVDLRRIAHAILTSMSF